MKAIRIILTVCLALLSQAQLFAQTPYNAESRFEVKQLQEDYNVLKKVLGEVQIGLYRYTTKSAMDSLFSSCYRQIDKPMTETEFYRIVNRTVNAIRDEHTFALPSQAFWDSQIGQTVYYRSVKGGSALLFPFFVKIIGDHLYIDNNLSDDQTLKRGDEILEINGSPAQRVLDILLPTIHTNGYIETYRKRNLEQFSMNQTYNRFMVHYALFIGTPAAFALKVKRYLKSQSETLNVTALTSKTIFEHYWRRYSTVNDPKKRKENPLEFDILNSKTAYLRLSDFHNDVWLRYNYSVSTEFRSIIDLLHKKSIENLIIDLRGNEGGNLGIGMQLMPYLANKTFQPYQYYEVNNYKFPDISLYFSDPKDFPNYPDELFIPQKNGTFRTNTQYKTENWSRPMEPYPAGYKGKLYVLINGATGSAASIFATVLRVNRRDAIFVGEEGGGDMEGPVSGSGTDITLPNTKIRVNISWIKRLINLNGNKSVKGHGIQPDYHVVPALSDFTSDRDTELQFVISLIKRGVK